ncbi:hypothetical protein D3C77_726410 [compost metagenome]
MLLQVGAENGAVDVIEQRDHRLAALRRRQIEIQVVALDAQQVRAVEPGAQGVGHGGVLSVKGIAVGQRLPVG